MFGNNPTLRFPGNLAQVSNITELRGVSPYEMNDESAILVTAAGLFTFDASSTANDDGVYVIRPNGFTPLQAGRWVKPGPQAPTPADGNTFATLAALQASGLDVAYLVGDPDNPDGMFFKVGGTLVRQKSGSITFGAKSYGAKGDGVTDDIAAIKLMINDNTQLVNEKGGAGYWPRGTYRTSDKIDNIGTYSTYRGDGERVSIMERSGSTAFPAIHRNAGVQWGRARISNMGFRGYSHAVLISDDTDGIDMDNLDIAGSSSAGVQFDNQWQTSSFDRVVVRSGSAGFVSNTGVANAVRMNKCETTDLSGEHIKLNGAEDMIVASHRFEGGGLIGGYTLNLSNVKQLTFDGGYMESTHEYAARIVATTGIIVFRNIHFTGTGARVEGTAGPYKWLTDSVGGLVFENCDSTFPMRVPAHAELRGVCPGILRSGLRGNASRPPQNITTSTNFAVARFTRLSAVADEGNVTALTGDLNLEVTHVDGTGALTRLSRKIQVTVVGKGAALTISAVTKDANDTGTAVSDTNFNSSIDAGGLSGLLTINLAPLTTGVPVFKESAEIVWRQTASLDQNTFAVELQ